MLFKLAPVPPSRAAGKSDSKTPFKQNLLHRNVRPEQIKLGLRSREASGFRTATALKVSRMDLKETLRIRP